MTQSSSSPLRLAMVIILATAYAIVLIMLISTSRRVQSLVPQVTATEGALNQAMSQRGTEVQAMRAELASAEQRRSTLESSFPRDVQVQVVDRILQIAQQGGIAEFRFQRTGESSETMQAGAYKVYQFTIQGRATQEQVATFMDRLLKEFGSAVLVNNVILRAAGKDWQFSADVVVYTLME